MADGPASFDHCWKKTWRIRGGTVTNCHEIVLCASFAFGDGQVNMYNCRILNEKHLLSQNVLTIVCLFFLPMRNSQWVLINDIQLVPVFQASKTTLAKCSDSNQK